QPLQLHQRETDRFSYHDPVYVFAGKFSSSGFFINFSNWFLPPEEGGEPWGRGYLDFTNPNALVNRYYNLYNYINEKLTDFLTMILFMYLPVSFQVRASL
ncbi:hypothetical protein, partial [Chryseobacterium sp. CH1]|uniref:hypothetical protein n=1 Tax=Chryseobacterium sp. CH1 TaxID=713551 RepID=UPI001024A344